jgi:hypothetical protein
MFTVAGHRESGWVDVGMKHSQTLFPATRCAPETAMTQNQIRIEDVVLGGEAGQSKEAFGCVT